MKPKPTRPIDEHASPLPAARFETAPQSQKGGNDEPAPLLAAITHRLSQPLTALRGTLELARLRAKSVAEYRDAVEKALESAEHLAWLVQSLREMAEVAVPAGERATIALDQVARSVLEDLRPLADPRGIYVESKIARGLRAQTYPDQLYQALLKVGHHAILRNPEGKTVRMELRSVQDEAQWIVTDEGPPFSFEAAEHFLETLLAGPSAPGGFGESVLGLVTAKRFIEALGGSLSVEGLADRGNRVVIRLPALSREGP